MYKNDKSCSLVAACTGSIANWTEYLQFFPFPPPGSTHIIRASPYVLWSSTCFDWTHDGRNVPKHISFNIDSCSGILSHPHHSYNYCTIQRRRMVFTCHFNENQQHFDKAASGRFITWKYQGKYEEFPVLKLAICVLSTAPRPDHLKCGRMEKKWKYPLTDYRLSISDSMVSAHRMARVRFHALQRQRSWEYSHWENIIRINRNVISNSKKCLLITVFSNSNGKMTLMLKCFFEMFISTVSDWMANMSC